MFLFFSQGGISYVAPISRADKEWQPLPPNGRIHVDREGWQHAIWQSNPSKMVRRLISLVFTFEEVMGTLGKRKADKRKDSDEKSLEDANVEGSFAWKLQLLFGKFFVYFVCLMHSITIFFYFFIFLTFRLCHRSVPKRSL